jgi:hypothetical protein
MVHNISRYMLLFLPRIMAILDNLCELALTFGTYDAMLVSIPLVVALVAVDYLALSRRVILHTAGGASSAKRA